MPSHNHNPLLSTFLVKTFSLSYVKTEIYMQYMKVGPDWKKKQSWNKKRAWTLKSTQMRQRNFEHLAPWQLSKLNLLMTTVWYGEKLQNSYWPLRWIVLSAAVSKVKNELETSNGLSSSVQSNSSIIICLHVFIVYILQAEMLFKCLSTQRCASRKWEGETW